MGIIGTLQPVAQWAGIVLPSIYAGVTLQYSLGLNVLIQTQTPTKLLARQWYILYRLGPVWVPPMVIPAVLANVFLALTNYTSNPHAALWYASAALTIVSIFIVTFRFFEPRVNGACKLKLESLFSEDRLDGVVDGDADSPTIMNGKTVGVVGDGEKEYLIDGTLKHSANEASREWAENESMETLVATWARWNHGRWVIGMTAAVLSGIAGNM